MSRPRSFDEAALLDAAQEEFWVSGYDRTSIETISSVTGIGNGSIYAAYGNKLGLFLATFSRYCDGRVELVDTVIRSHRGTFEEAVANYLDQIVSDCTSHDDRRGCLMLNSLAELGSRFPDVVTIGNRTNARMERIVTERVAEGVADRDIELLPAEVDALGAHIVLVSQGLIQNSRLGTPTDKLRSIAATSSRMSALLAA